MTAWRRAALLFLIVLWCLPPAMAGMSAADEKELLQKMEAALAVTYYQGILVTVRKAGAAREDEVAKAWFGPHGRQALEIVTPSWRRGERLIVDGGHRWIVYPDCEAALSLPMAVQDRPGGSIEGARLEGTELLGERQVFVLLWRGGLGARRVWIDAERFVPLKYEDRDSQGELLLLQALEEVKFLKDPPLDRFRFAPNPEWTVYTDEEAFHQAVSLHHVQRGVDFRIRQPKHLPPDFAFRRAFLRELARLVVIQLRYSNPKGGAISLFEYRADPILTPPAKQFLADAGVGRQAKLNFLRWRAEELEFVLVGDLPPQALRAVAKSIK